MATAYVIYIGPYNLDLMPLQGKLVDVEEGGMQGYRTELDGYPSVTLSLAEAMPLHGAAAGVPQDVYDHFVMCNDTVDMIDDSLVIAEKQVEVLKESRAFYVDARQNDISIMADAMKSRAHRRKDPSILVPFEKLLKYNSQIGDKAYQTRKKNEQLKAEQDEQPPATDPAPPAPPEPPAPPV